MIPNFDGNGNLPPGIYECTLEEFEKRFVNGIKRIQIYEGMKKLIIDLKKIGCNAIYIDGSYVTKKRLPNDFDACWDNTGIDYYRVITSFPELNPKNRLLQNTKYFADVFPAYMKEIDHKVYFIDFFQVDKTTGTAKGIIKIKI